MIVEKSGVVVAGGYKLSSCPLASHYIARGILVTWSPSPDDFVAAEHGVASVEWRVENRGKMIEV